MKHCRACLIALAASLPLLARAETPTPVSAPETALKNVVSTPCLEFYRASDARWLVDRRHGVVSAWKLEADAPLWSDDGVVFRLTTLANQVVPTFNVDDAPLSETATEICGRVYFFLDDTKRRHVAENDAVLRNDLLVALDSRAQGRLVWTRRAKDFAPFFTSDAASLRFVPPLAPLANDKLAIRIRNDQETKEFAIDAADGSFHLR